MVHFASAVCLLLAWLSFWNVHRRIAHLPSPVADNYRSATAYITVDVCTAACLFTPRALTSFCLMALGSPPLTPWAATRYAPWTVLHLPWPGHL